MLQKTIASYGGPKSDGAPVESPDTQVSSAELNRLMEDTAQLTIAGARAGVVFPTVASGSSTISTAWSVWGSGQSVWPSVARTGTGLYTITYATTYTDGLGVVETVGLLDAAGGVRSVSVFGSVQCSVTSANVVSLVVLNTAGAAADLTVGTKIGVWIR